MGMFTTTDSFDGHAAVTRSLLGYGVVAGVLYLALGLGQALTREGFDLTRHALSLLELGDLGWVQRLNLTLTAGAVAATAVGFRRVRGEATARAGWLLLVHAAALVGAAVFAPDPVAGFPPGNTATTASVSGLLHLVWGAAGFLAVAAAAEVIARWHGAQGRHGHSRVSRAAAATVAISFLVGAGLSATPVGVGLIWVAVLAMWGWLAWCAVDLYRRVPDPVIGRRTAPATADSR